MHYYHDHHHFFFATSTHNGESVYYHLYIWTSDIIEGSREFFLHSILLQHYGKIGTCKLSSVHKCVCDDRRGGIGWKILLFFPMYLQKRNSSHDDWRWWSYHDDNIAHKLWQNNSHRHGKNCSLFVSNTALWK